MKVATVRKGTAVRSLEAAGTLEPPPGRDVKLGPLSAGRLALVAVAEGDRVSAGQLLARLDPTPLRDAAAQATAQLLQARAQEANARVRQGRAEKAFEAGVAAGQEVDDAKLAAASAQASVHGAEAALSTARNALSRSELRAPFAGVVAHVFVPAGEPVDAGKPVVEVARTDILELRVPLAPEAAALVHKGQAAEVRVDGLTGRVLQGTVVAVAPVLDAATGTALARIAVENRDGALKGGTFARARIAAETREGALLVPREALLSSDENGVRAFAVELVDKGDLAKRQPVETGFEDAGAVELLKGVSEGDRVVIGGAYALPDGTKLTVEPAGAPAADGAEAGKAKGTETHPLEKEQK